MKALLLCLLLAGQPNPKQLGLTGKPTRYKPGFTYHTRCYESATLVRWERHFNGLYRWKVRYEAMGHVYVGYTDDEWIDLHTDQAFYNARTRQIVYYDSVDILPKRSEPFINVKVSNNPK